MGAQQFAAEPDIAYLLSVLSQVNDGNVPRIISMQPKRAWGTGQRTLLSGKQKLKYNFQNGAEYRQNRPLPL